ncbi:MAG: Asp23/Gls24 family envelope stress response protein [Oscillospiraceae bacterium]|nr:Asp23/Gls24 family envelope stress response protein [Oscillospiraceae bacterium]
MADNYIIFPDERGSINISEEVVAVVAGSAALDVEGVSGFPSSSGRDTAELISKKTASKSVKLQIVDREVSIDVSLTVEMGTSVNKIGEKVQEAVKSEVEASTGLTVTGVDVHICGITPKKKA